MYYNLFTLEKLLARGASAIYRAILKYDYSDFNLYILEYCDLDILIKREQYYLDLLKPEYNILKVAGSRLGHTASLKTRETISLALLGHKFSKETKLKISSALKGNKNGMYNKHQTEEAKLKMSFKKTGSNHPMFGKKHLEETKKKYQNLLNYIINIIVIIIIKILILKYSIF